MEIPQLKPIFYEIRFLPEFEKDFKKLLKRYRTLLDDLRIFIEIQLRDFIRRLLLLRLYFPPSLGITGLIFIQVFSTRLAPEAVITITITIKLSKQVMALQAIPILLLLWSENQVITVILLLPDTIQEPYPEQIKSALRIRLLLLI